MPPSAATSSPGSPSRLGQKATLTELGNGLHATLGVVGHGRLLRGNAREVVGEVRAFAPWIVASFDPDRIESGSTGAASLQWGEEKAEGAHLIGDAGIARDSRFARIRPGDRRRAASGVSGGDAARLRPEADQRQAR